MVAERGPSDQRVKLVRRIASKIFIRRPIALRFAAQTAAQFANCASQRVGSKNGSSAFQAPKRSFPISRATVVLICRCKQVILIEYASRITVWNARVGRHGESCKAAAERDAVLRPRR